MSQHKNVSDATAKLIDEEIRELIEAGEDNARRILNEHMDDLHTLAKGLLEYETLSGDEVQQLLEGGQIDRPDPDGDAAGEGARSSVPSSGAAGKKDRPSGGFEPEPQPQS